MRLTQPQPVFSLMHRVLLVSLVPTPDVSLCFMLLSDLRNEAEMFSKGKMRCCQKAKNKIIPTEFIGFGSVELFA